MKSFIEKISLMIAALTIVSGSASAGEYGSTTILLNGVSVPVSQVRLARNEIRYLVIGGESVHVSCLYEGQLKLANKANEIVLKDKESTVLIAGDKLVMYTCAPLAQSQVSDVEVVLKSRYGIGGNYETATYSFRHMTQGNLPLTRNNWEILYEARSDFQDYFDVNTVVDDRSNIYDLGNHPCAEVKEVALGMLSHRGTGRQSETISVSKGHCYLSVNEDDSGQIATLFRVKEQIPHQSIVIGEIEVLFDSAKVQRPRR